MSRFYISLADKPKVVIEFTEDMKDTFKPQFEIQFGVKFLASETQKGETLRYEFVANEDDFIIVEQILKELYEKRIVKDIDINIQLN